MQSKAATPDAYLKALPPDRRDAIATLRALIRKHLPKGYEEAVRHGMLVYEIPLSRYPKTYNKEPLMYAALASQKNYYALYLMCLYGNKERLKVLQDAFKKAGKKLDMGKACLRFKDLDGLPLDVLGVIIASTPLEDYLKVYEASRNRA